MKVKCSTCKRNLAIDAFSKNKSKKNGVNTKCKECQRKYFKKHYDTNTDYYLRKASSKRDETREWFKNYKSTCCCARCPENHPSCLDFHHIDPNSKLKPVSQMIGTGVSIETILEEIAKYIVLCANCHRKLHWQ